MLRSALRRLSRVPVLARLSRRAWAHGLGALAVTFYVAQHARIGPNHVDGGLLLGYIQTIADGGRPYFDFVDLYGLLSWPLPVLFYVAAGQKVWGLRVWLVVIKLMALFLSFRLVRQLANTTHAWAAVVLLALLLGVPWQLLQTTYAFLPALVLELSVVLLVVRPGGPGWGRLALASVLTGLTLCTKLNSGALLWAGLMFVCFYAPGQLGQAAPGGTQAPASRPQSRMLSLVIRGLQWLGLLAYAAIFHLFIREHYHALYAVYLTVPLLLMLASTAVRLPAPEAFTRHLARWAVAASVPPLVALALLWAYLGEALPSYAQDMAAILGRLDYVAPVPPVGEPGNYVGFNEYYWPQFHWLLSLVFVVFWWAAGRAGRLPRSSVPALFALFVCNLFVMYSRTDESHLHQSMLLGVPLLPVMWFEISKSLPARRAALSRAGLAFLAFACLTIGTRPRLELFSGARGDWHTPRLEGLFYARDPDPYVRPLHAGANPRTWDETTDRIAYHIRMSAREGEEVFVMARNELINYASHTLPAGGRNRYYWYLLKNAHLTPDDLRAIGPPTLVSALVDDPPSLIVVAFGDTTIFNAYREIRTLLTTRYERIVRSNHLAIYALKDRNRRPIRPRGRL